ncbi:tRNA (5-methylaminomethyl-2-thiouridine)(34)-methyltransferase MnmD [Formosa sediminum]|uniref:tRNA (5-methylaminomethyl-2-thiouridine)(34)-methyltransferase MnmD n=1 Tax=Formosa sediminum TaxID=2594004 RepID=A0A516GQY5_9FLAO|nr:tRNA (5-methylaminomethyl-2-thiouridine)(34)-methyltransferase MnmD [Formosa sediminum]QDO93928.1 tRNA (5-methylaminomethyl-2-thiouridine)(34)-methyltransferase MnmD [Formosa sediminum]
MERKFITTADGSSTIYLPDLDETYHSRHGAVQEALHVFITSGLQYSLQQHPDCEERAILEIGFGTGLNAFLTCLEAESLLCKINYFGVEAYPITTSDLNQINYAQTIKDGRFVSIFNALHTCSWDVKQAITSSFFLTKQQKSFKDIEDVGKYDIIYFDAFGPRKQPELWGESIFSIMYNALKSGGVLVTYCAQGNARRAMQAVGFNVARIPGPPGKREMLRAIKI